MASCINGRPGCKVEKLHYHDIYNVIRYDNDVTAAFQKLSDWGEHNSVQLAGCLVVAEGGSLDPEELSKDAYGWSASFEAVRRLRIERDALLKRFAQAATCPKPPTS